MASANLGQVVPIITVLEDTPTSYRLQFATRTDVFVTPNLRGRDASGSTDMVTTFVNIMDAGVPTVIPMSDLGLDVTRTWYFMVIPGIDFPLFRNANAQRVSGNAISISMYSDTNPYTQPVLGTPPGAGFATTVKIGATGLKVGGFSFGMPDPGSGGGGTDPVEGFPLILLCFAS
jgi:hypothetical protein